MAKLTIKAANGSVDDFQMEAPLEWTVLELKRYLFRHYPNKPGTISQKLICGGKLLQDEAKISQLLPARVGVSSPSTEEPLVIHFVVYDRSASAPILTNSTSSLRSAATSSQSDMTSSSGEGLADGERGPTGAVPPRLDEPQLGNQWLRHRGGMMHNQNNIQNLPMFAPGGGGYPYPMAPPSQFYMSPYGAAPYGAAYANQLQQWYNTYYGPREPGPGEDVEGGGAEGHPLDLPLNPDARNDLPDADDPEDLPMNAPGGMGMMGGAGGGGGGLRRRDMVDYLYMFMMVSFLVLVAYLTNSLGRLLIFIGGIIFMLLNQGGFFSLQRRRVAVHDHVPAPQAPPEDERGQQNQDEADGQHEERVAAPGAPPNTPAEAAAPQAPEDPGSHHPSPPPAVAPNVEQRGPGFLATIMVFVTTFFTSLVPQQRPELQVN